MTFESSFDTVGAGVFAALGVFVLFLVAIGLVMYLLQSFAMMKMAENAGIENGWLAFIPVANYWIYGELISEKLGGQGGKKVLLVMVGLAVLSVIPILGFVTSLASLVFSLVMMYWLLSKYSENDIIWLVVSLITFGLAYPIILFALRNNKARY